MHEATIYHGVFFDSAFLASYEPGTPAWRETIA